jgi:uncharacterized protein YjbI with pentapeptide repeats
LYEAGLLHKENPVIDLAGADLSAIDLHNKNLSGGGAFLNNSSLSYALSIAEGIAEPGKSADLSGAILSDANLEHALLSDTDLSEADLRDADLSHASLSKTDLFNANLSDANLSEAYLSEAYLSFADLSGADLSGANLNGANLNGAYLSGAQGVTNEQLDKQAASLKRATMPNGQKYEDWLKSRGEDGGHSSAPS